MITAEPTMTNLFDQLGLDSSPEGIKQFILSHRLERTRCWWMHRSGPTRNVPCSRSSGMPMRPGRWWWTSSARPCMPSRTSRLRVRPQLPGTSRRLVPDSVMQPLAMNPWCLQFSGSFNPFAYGVVHMLTSTGLAPAPALRRTTPLDPGLAALEAFPDAVFVVGLDGRLARCNRHALSLLEHSGDALEGSVFEDRFVASSGRAGWFNSQCEPAGAHGRPAAGPC